MKQIITIFVASLFANSINAGVIDFEDLGVAVGSAIMTADGAITSTGGFDVDSGVGHIHFHNQDGFGDNGTTNAGVHSTLSFSQSGGGAFSLVDFQMDYFISDLGSLTVNAILAGGGSTSQVFATDGVAGGSYETFLLNASFQNIVSATIDSLVPYSAGNNGYFVDNITWGEASVPEPSILALLGMGLLGLGLTRRRKLAR